jgi:serine/threonine protein kinase
MRDFPLIPGYRIKKILGQGGMANVYLGVQENLNRLVAIKVLKLDILESKKSYKRFLKEARTLSQLIHPNIVTIHDVGRIGNYYYIVMEYLQESLKEKINKNHKIEPEHALHIITSIADSLYYAHEKGVVHRDVKPANILFRKDGTPVILDFGIAKITDSKTKLTKTGMYIGTPKYMSPEQFNVKKLDGRSDIYSLGVVLYEMLTGKVPYNAKDTLGIMMKHLQEPVPTLPKALKNYQLIIDKMMEKERNKRVRSKEKLDEIIKKLLNLKTIKETKKNRTKKIKKQHKISKTEETLIHHPYINKTDKEIISKEKRITKGKFLLWLLTIVIVAILVFQIFKEDSLLDLISILSNFFQSIRNLLF